MKAIVLTYAKLTKNEQELIKNTDIFKIACNFHCAELKPNVRLCADNIVKKCLDCDNCKVVSLNYDLELNNRVINGCYLPKRHTTLVSCVDYLYLQGYTSILLVATNPDSPTCKLNIEGIDSIKDCLYLYKYSNDCNLDIPYKSIKDFIMMTEEEKLLGVKETAEKKLLKTTIFTDSCLYEVQSEGKNNKSIENGTLLENILPAIEKQKLLEGLEEINYNGLIIKRLTGIKPKEESKEEIKDEVIEEQEDKKEEQEIVKPKKTVRKKK